MRGRVATALAVVLALLLLPVTPALASHDGAHVGTDQHAVTGARGGAPPGGSEGGSRAPAASGGSSPAAEQPIYDVGLAETDDGEGGTTQCWTIETGGGQTLAEARDMLDSFDGNGTLFDACPAGQRGPTLAERVQAQFERWSPTPVQTEIAPGYAITGLKAFLVIDDPNPGSISLVGESIELRKEYRVRWGDGKEQTTDSTGVPYPGGDGEIVHLYQHAKAVTVEVDVVVTGTWNGRTLGTLAPVTSTMDLPVREVQAVRRR